MHNELIEKLSRLNMEKTCIIRALDKYYANRVKRNSLFKRMEEIEKEINYIKFKLEMERRNEKNISD